MNPAETLARARRHWGRLPQGLLDHLERASVLAADLARRWGVDPERAALAGYLHDIARAEPLEALAARARSYGLTVHPVEEALPVLLHGPVGAAQARTELGIEDGEVLAAVAWHSTGRWGMGALEKAVFLADKLDPEKEGYYPGLERLPELAQRDLDGAVLRYLEWQVGHILAQSGLLHPAAIEARNWLLLQRGARKPSAL
ncbi:MAG: bis(5'-nucleosyl)-tetraphosphatase (symmetrical) YqeK [Chloroflexi bacterium]|nr:bis(5'-nucleosyl)-tetraphosphatase (symmetrical) YqeK [Chloroflexota bacterium]